MTTETLPPSALTETTATDPFGFPVLLADLLADWPGSGADEACPVCGLPAYYGELHAACENDETA